MQQLYGNDAVTPDTLAYLEVKERINVRMRKRRVALPYDQAVAFDNWELRGRAVAVRRQWCCKRWSTIVPTPQLGALACIVHYDRTLCMRGGPPMRIRARLFDRTRAGRIDDLLGLDRYATDQHFLPLDRVVLEVKANQNVPAWLVQLLSRHGCTYYRISKYCAALEKSKAITRRQHVAYAPAVAPSR